MSISIHAPLTGCDSFVLIKSMPRALFQSTHPSRGATVLCDANTPELLISIHAPLTGCDRGSVPVWPVGCNFNPRTPHGVRPPPVSVASSGAGNFNPRTPHGVRRIWQCKIIENCDFNPRTPHGVRLPTEKSTTKATTFQSTHPSRGATAQPRLSGAPKKDFNPRTPHGVRPQHKRFDSL